MEIVERVRERERIQVFRSMNQSSRCLVRYSYSEPDPRSSPHLPKESKLSLSLKDVLDR